MYERIRKIVKRLTKYYKTRSPYELALSRGYHVIYSSTLPARIAGMFVPVGIYGAIYINSGAPQPRHNAILAHELGHGVLRHEGQRFSTQSDYYHLSWRNLSIQEREAHLFSACLLLDDTPIETGSTIEQVSVTSGVSPKVIDMWFREKNRISNDFYF